MSKDAKGAVLYSRGSIVKTAVYSTTHRNLTIFISETETDDGSYVPAKSINLEEGEAKILYLFLREMMKETAE